MNYGEGVRHSYPSKKSFDIVRPTIELILDELLMEAAPKHGPCPPSPLLQLPQSRQPDLATESEMEMKNEAFEQHRPAFSQAHFARGASRQEQTVSPSRLGHRSDTPTGSNPTRPTLSVRTRGATTRSSGPGGTATNSPTALPQPGTNGSNAPGGIKAECSNWAATRTPIVAV